MSYCRWSSDNWRSDVYCYESDQGYMTHVASNRVVGDIPPWPTFETLKSDVSEYMRQYQAMMDFLDTAERAPIGLPHDGESFCDSTPEDFLQTLTMLQEAGYNVPQYAFDTVREEIAEQDSRPWPDPAD